jgi:hypothetical protein
MMMAGLAALALLGACASPPRTSAPVIPTLLAVPANQTLSRVFKAIGAQVYECKANAADLAKMEWIFKAPEAQMRDAAGRVVGRHYSGPTWEALDTSKVIAEVRVRISAPDPDAIPWLLLSTTSTTGHGMLSQTKSVQRLNTSGGKAPSSGCDLAHAGQEIRVPYSADYLFYQ